MNAHDVAALVVERAERHGVRNAQQIAYLVDRLSKVQSDQLALGLIEVFTTGEASPQQSRAQELAGKLLAELRPRGTLDVEKVLRLAIPRYELSVEQFPQYLADMYGLVAVSQLLARLEAERLGESELKAVKTLQFWLRNRAA